MASSIDLTAAELAKWLVEHAPERLWGVDGEPQIEESLSSPCTGEELAAELTRRGGWLRLSTPPGTEQVRARDLGSLGDVAGSGSDGEIVFRAAWLVDGSEGPEWTIMTDVLAEEATRSAYVLQQHRSA